MGSRVFLARRRRALRLRADEQGIAMIMALGMLSAFSIVAMAMLEYTASNTRTQRYDASTQSASSLAEAGLNEAIAVLANASNPASPGALPPGSATYATGGATWSGTYDSGIWTVTAVSTVKNPSGAADLRATSAARFQLGVDTLAAGNGAWRTVYADTGCSELKNSSVLSAVFTTRGDLCLKNSAQLNGPETTVAGHVTLKNSSTVVTGSLHAGSGCGTSASGPWSLSRCNPSNGVTASVVDSAVPPLSKPPIDLAAWYAQAAPGPLASCTSGSFPGGFDNNWVLDRSLPTATLLPSSGYSCTVTAGGATIGRIVWTPGSPGSLDVSGVIFFDGNVRIGGQAVYTGRGTIYASGSIEFANTDQLCAVSGCATTGTWGGMLVLVAGASGEESFEMENSSLFQGGVYAVGEVEFENSSAMEGPIVCDRLEMENGSGRRFDAVRYLPYGTPAAPGTSTLSLVAGSWGG